MPIGADKKPEVKPDKILINKFIFLLIGFFFSLEIKKNKEKIIVIIEKNKIRPSVFKLAANIVPKITPKTTKIPKVFTTLKSTALYFMCVITDEIEVGIIMAKDVPTAKCIVND